MQSLVENREGEIVRTLSVLVYALQGGMAYHPKLLREVASSPAPSEPRRVSFASRKMGSAKDDGGGGGQECGVSSKATFIVSIIVLLQRGFSARERDRSES